MKRILRAALAVPVLFAACESDPADRILRVSGTARIVGLLYLDANHNATFQQGVDPQLAGQYVVIRRAGSTLQVDSVRSDSVGFFAFTVPPGTYELAVPDRVLADTLVVAALPSPFTLGARDTLSVVTLGLRYRTFDPAAVRALPPGTRVWLSGIALNSPVMFGDSTVHVQDASGAIRVTNVPPVPIQAGDSLFFFGTRSTRDGQPTFMAERCHPSRPTCFVAIAGPTFEPAPVAVSTGQAAAADGGALDAMLVRITNAVIADTATVAGARWLLVDDGSGPVQVVLSAAINFGQPPVATTFVPGVRIAATGVLAPVAGGGSWVIRPRNRNDLGVLP